MKLQTKETIREIYRTNLGLNKRETILVFTDCKRGKLYEITREFAEIGRTFSQHLNFCTFARTTSHGSEPPEDLWHAAFGHDIYKGLKDKGLLKDIIEKNISDKRLKQAEKIVRFFKKDVVDVVVALSRHSTSHTRFRDMITRICRARYASMPLFDIPMLEYAMRVDVKKMLRQTSNIARQVKKADKINITTPCGTSIILRRGDRAVNMDTGMIRKPAEFSNLPAGEVYLAPLEGTASGRMVLEWAPTRRLKSRIILSVAKGKVVSVKGSEQYASYLRKILAQRKENRNIAELGIGTNDRASRPDNILESEKILGTIHIALGDNSSFGGKVSTPFHQDFIFFQPTVTLIQSNGKRKLLLKDGKLF